MADSIVPHFHNDAGVDSITIGAHEFMCVGALPPFDHPHVFIDMGDEDEAICPYCSTVYRFDPSLGANESRPAGCVYQPGRLRTACAIAVAGGGIAGLTAAIALAARGFQSTSSSAPPHWRKSAPASSFRRTRWRFSTGSASCRRSPAASSSRRRSSSASARSGSDADAAAARQDRAGTLRRALLHAAPRRSAGGAPRDRAAAARDRIAPCAPRSSDARAAENGVAFAAGGDRADGRYPDRRRRHPLAHPHRLLPPSRAAADRPNRVARDRCRPPMAAGLVASRRDGALARRGRAPRALSRAQAARDAECRRRSRRGEGALRRTQPFGPAAQRLIDAVANWTPWPLAQVDCKRCPGRAAASRSSATRRMRWRRAPRKAARRRSRMHGCWPSSLADAPETPAARARALRSVCAGRVSCASSQQVAAQSRHL